jgi:hypothetical protein
LMIFWAVLEILAISWWILAQFECHKRWVVGI